MNVTYQESILYYDCELIFEAADETGRRYISVHTGEYETGCEYIIAPTSPESLGAFKNGKIDLRLLLLDSPTEEWYTAALDVNDDDVAIALKQKDTPISGCNDLPGTGFYIGVGNSGDMVQEDVQPTAPANTAMPNATDPRLFERWLSINEVSTEAIRERAGTVPNPTPHQLHVWWARRPLAPSRASTLLSLIPHLPTTVIPVIQSSTCLAPAPTSTTSPGGWLPLPRVTNGTKRVTANTVALLRTICRPTNSLGFMPT